MWPGYGENLRVLEWILDRCNNKVEAVQSSIGFVPHAADIDMTGLNLPAGALEKLLAINNKEWLGELHSIKEFFGQFKKDLPQELWEEYAALEERLTLK